MARILTDGTAAEAVVVVDQDGNYSTFSSSSSGTVNPDGTTAPADFTETNARLGAKSEPAAANSAAISGLNGLIRLFINLFINRFTSTSNGLKVDNSGVTQPISASQLPLPSGAAKELTLVEIKNRIPNLGQTVSSQSLPVTLSNDGAFTTNFGLSSANAAVSDTATVSFISLFKRLLQHISSLLSVLPTSLSNDRLKVENETSKLVDVLMPSEAPLVTAGFSSTQSVRGYSKYTYQIQFTGITQAILRMEGNNTGNQWTNINPNGENKTITANEQILITFEGKLGQVRINLVSVTGSAPSVVVQLLKGN